MSEFVSNLISALLIRVRDPAGTLRGASNISVRTLAIDLIGRAQQIYNEGLSLVIQPISFTAQPLMQWYNLLDVIGPTNERITSISHAIHQGRDLTKATLDDLKSLDRQWHRRVDTRLECFIPLGYTNFILWPMLNYSSTCTLYGPLLTPLIQDENQESLSISEERSILLLQLIELMLSNRANDELAFSTLLKNFSKYLPQDAAKESRRGSPDAPEITY